MSLWQNWRNVTIQNPSNYEGQAFANKAEARYVRDLERMIADNPTVFTAKRFGVADRVRGEPTETALGEWQGFLAEVRQSRVAPTYDEKGTTSRHPYILVALYAPVGTFKLDDQIVANNRKFAITSVSREGVVSEINLELRQ